MLPSSYSWLIIRKMFTSGAIQEPPSFPIKPFFAELVVTYLRKSEWDKNISFYPGKPPKQSPYTCRYDRYHLKLLENVESCQAHLSTAWKEWIRLGHYQMGNSQRDMLITTAMSWVEERRNMRSFGKGQLVRSKKDYNSRSDGLRLGRRNNNSLKRKRGKSGRCLMIGSILRDRLFSECETHCILDWSQIYCWDRRYINNKYHYALTRDVR